MMLCVCCVCFVSFVCFVCFVCLLVCLFCFIEKCTSNDKPPTAPVLGKKILFIFFSSHFFRSYSVLFAFYFVLFCSFCSVLFPLVFLSYFGLVPREFKSKGVRAVKLKHALLNFFAERGEK